jgi:hypothetical protein
MINLSEYQGQLDRQHAIASLLEKSPTKVVCSSKIEWADLDGSRTTTESGYYFSVRQARKNALRSAIRMGWKPPKWWQWWRWGEQRVSLDFSVFDQNEAMAIAGKVVI